jgi:membrane-bound lytic murein transglycosylase D
MVKYIISIILLLLINNLVYPQEYNLKTTIEKRIEADQFISMMDTLQRLTLFECNDFLNRSLVLNDNEKGLKTTSDSIIKERLLLMSRLTPIPLEYNDHVKKYIQLYLRNKGNNFGKILGMTHLYYNLIEEQLDRFNLPLELKHLAIVESALNPNATSITGAAGIWQFMMPTGKMFGLNVNSFLDDRRDPLRSTIAACKYFKYLFGIFNDWHLVIAAYNCGPNTILKAIQRSGGSMNYWQIRPLLPKETQNYVPAFIAVNYVCKYSTEYQIFPNRVKSNYFFADTILIKNRITFHDISKATGLETDDIKFLNPIYKLGIIPFNEAGLPLCLPANKIGIFIDSKIELNPTGSVSDEHIDIYKKERKYHYYHVKHKQSLKVIAEKENVTPEEIKNWNNLKVNWVLKGKKLKIMNRVETNVNQQDIRVTIEETDEVKSNEAKSINQLTQSIPCHEKISFKRYKVKKGDTLYNLAKRHKGITVSEIITTNNFTYHNKLKVGSIIKIPVK